MKHFYSAQDVQDLPRLIKKALLYKSQPLQDQSLGKNKRIGLIFFNPSLRTRLSTQIAAKNLGMEAIVLNSSLSGGADNWALEFQEGAIMNGTTVEHIKDAAPILGSFFDILAVRSFPKLQSRSEDESDTVFNAFKKYAGVPVVSLESATRHPLQSFADLITIEENSAPTSANTLNNPTKKRLKIVLAWAPHIKPIPHCVANSFSEWVNLGRKTQTALQDAEFVIAHPQGYELSSEYTQDAKIVHSLEEALVDANFVYLKNWSGYHEKTGYGKLLDSVSNTSWLLTEDHFKKAKNTHAKIMHCLPLRRNVEVADEILDGPRSLVTELAKNRVWSAQTVLSEILNKATS